MKEKTTYLTFLKAFLFKKYEIMSKQNEKNAVDEMRTLQENYMKKFGTIVDTFYFGNDPEEINAEIRKALASGKPIEYDLPEGAVT